APHLTTKNLYHPSARNSLSSLSTTTEILRLRCRAAFQENRVVPISRHSQPFASGCGECAMPLEPVSLDDKYDLRKSRIFVTGFRARGRWTRRQRGRARGAGLNTAGYVTGYRGSPLGTLDQQFQRASSITAASDVKFPPATNEDLAATA